MALALGWKVLLILLLSVLHVDAASSPDPVPPFQWINLTGLLRGPPPPGLKDVAMAYNPVGHQIIIFGGEASSGVAQDQTYLLDLDSLTWTVPAPATNLSPNPPPARSAAIAGYDSAASNRNGFVVIGGKGPDGSALSDVWEYDFNNQFYAQVNISPGGPSPRWGSSGGIDPRVAPMADPVLPGPNNTIWLWGGENGQTTFSDLWRLNMSGTLSSNLPDHAVGSWEPIPLNTIPGLVAQGGGVLFSDVIFSGGCNGTTNAVDSCASQNTYIVDGAGRSGVAAVNCPAPRLSPTLVPNPSSFSPNFAFQMLLLLGTFNSSLWDDGNGLKSGEVAILDTHTTSWTRILPSGDPGTSGVPSFPSPREGAAAVMSTSPLVGNPPNSPSDIIVFGGRDESGNYLSEVWLLRAYNDSVTPTQPKYSGFGDGKLQTGVDASGAGVQNNFLTSCATARPQPSGSRTSSARPSSTSTSTSTPSSSPSSSPTAGGQSPSPSTSFDTSVVHKLLAPLSVALLLPCVILFRFTSPSFNNTRSSALSQTWCYVSVALGFFAFALGVAGVATSFTSVSSSDGTHPGTLSTAHGRAGLALFVSLYAVILLLALAHLSTRHTHTHISRERTDSDAAEKDKLPSSTYSPSPPASPRRRTPSWVPSSWRKPEDTLSIDTTSAETEDPFNTPPTHRSFEVINRPARTRRASGSRVGSPVTHRPQYSGSHSLGDLDWLNHRRSLTAVSELDLQAAAAAAVPPSTPGTLLNDPVEKMPSTMPSPLSMLLRLLFHAALLALCVFTLIALWSKAPKSTFGVFLAWTIAFYLILITFGWRGKPDRSAISLMLRRLRTEPQTTAAPRPSMSDTLRTDENVTPSFPYIHHRPAYRGALLTEHTGPQSTDTEEEDDEMTAETEMRGRNISIITSYPKQPLRITNPS
ncbi:hypothetical protein FB45DRAFT_1133214, partial [Roridomyces roridus]